MKQIDKAAMLSLLFTLSASVFSAEQPATIQLRTLSPHIAHKMVFAAVEDCTKRGFQVSASVVDRNGNLSAFLRNPRSGPHTIKVSQRKAFTSATLQRATSQMSSRPDLSFAPDILLIVGGVPIRFTGHFYGGIAVAGAPPEIDEECAKAGIEAVSDVMEFTE
jgi:uncharacterized protein GlcG (DUF336 family)